MGLGVVTFVVPRTLQLFLPAKKRCGEPEMAVDGTSTVGHLLAAVGVPKTEVGALVVNGQRVDRGYRPRPGDRILVVEVPRPPGLTGSGPVQRPITATILAYISSSPTVGCQPRACSFAVSRSILRVGR